MGACSEGVGTWEKWEGIEEDGLTPSCGNKIEFVE